MEQNKISVLAWLNGTEEEMVSFMESITHQTYREFELIVTGCSISKEMLELLGRYCSEKDSISVQEFNHIDHKKLEEYICFVDTKQVYSSTALEEIRKKKRPVQSQGSGVEKDKYSIMDCVFEKRLLWEDPEVKTSFINELVAAFASEMNAYRGKFSTEDGERVYTCMHEFLGQAYFDGVCRKIFKEQVLYQVYFILKNRDYKAFKSLTERELIVSLTSYPGRIGTVHQVIETITKQTHKPDRVILWLAGTQFPSKEQELPKELMQYVDRGELTILWCEDIRSHKKYYYNLLEYPEAVLITLDDDLLYKEQVIDMLYLSYLMYPNYVSAMRAHLMAITTDKKILPYDHWVKECKEWVLRPSMQLFATSGAGTLYPPNCMNPLLFDKEGIRETCINADDLWLKAMQVLNGTPIVLAQSSYGIRYVPGTQEETLANSNVLEKQNDVQLAKISKWIDEKLGGKDILVTDMFAEQFSDALVVASPEFYTMYANERSNNHDRRKHLNQTIDHLKNEKKDLSDKLQRTYDEKSEINRNLQEMYEVQKTLNEEIHKLKSKNKRQKKYVDKYKRIENSLWYRVARKLWRPCAKVKRLFH